MYNARVFNSLFAYHNLWINEHKHQCPFCEDYYDNHHQRYVYNSFNFISQHVKYSKFKFLGKHQNYIKDATKAFILSKQHIDRLYLSPFSLIDDKNARLVFFMQNLSKCEMALQFWARKCSNMKLHTILNFSPFHYLFSEGLEPYNDDFYQNLYDRNKIRIMRKRYNDDFRTQYNYHHSNVELADFIFFMPFVECAQFNQFLLSNNVPKRVIRLILQFYGSLSLNISQFFYRKNVFRYIQIRTNQLLPICCKSLISKKLIPEDVYDYLFVKKKFTENSERIMFMNFYLDSK